MNSQEACSARYSLPNFTYYLHKAKIPLLLSRSVHHSGRQAEIHSTSILGDASSDSLFFGASFDTERTGYIRGVNAGCTLLQVPLQRGSTTQHGSVMTSCLEYQ